MGGWGGLTLALGNQGTRPLAQLPPGRRLPAPPPGARSVLTTLRRPSFGIGRVQLLSLVHSSVPCP